MLRSLDDLDKGFLKAREKAKKECCEQLELLRELIYDIKPLTRTFVLLGEPQKQFDSLIFWNYLNFVRNCGYTLFLTYNSLYRNAFDSIRHILESIVQALYLDSRHPSATMKTKVYILSEVQDKHEYHVQSLIKKLDISNKERIKDIYKSLSKKIHPTTRTVKSIFEDYLTKDELPTVINCREILDIAVYLRDVIDVFFFLYIFHFPERKEQLKKDVKLNEYVRKYTPYLTSKALK